jgi:HSP20 family molecular chaperone IbpA
MENKEYCRMEDKKCFTIPENAVEIRPAVDVVEDDCGVKIMFEVPGANSETIDVSVAEGVLTMRACSTLKRNGFPVCYHRAFQLSDMVDIKGIKGNTCDGVLTLCLPKSERASVHRIKVD